MLVRLWLWLDAAAAIAQQSLHFTLDGQQIQFLHDGTTSCLQLDDGIRSVRLRRNSAPVMLLLRRRPCLDIVLSVLRRERGVRPGVQSPGM